MSDTADTADPAPAGVVGEPKGRRDFLYIATGALAAAGAAAAAWPFIDSMNPSADVLSLSTVEIDLEAIQPGQRVTAEWRGKPIFISHRTEEVIARARAEDKDEFRDPATDAERVQRPEWLIVIGICTHLGCVPLGQGERDERGDWDGWFCPCHGSHYDVAGRIRKGPAPENLWLPKYAFLTDTLVRIG